jgi:hypothetical protein
MHEYKVQKVGMNIQVCIFIQGEAVFRRRARTSTAYVNGWEKQLHKKLYFTLNHDTVAETLQSHKIVWRKCMYFLFLYSSCGIVILLTYEDDWMAATKQILLLECMQYKRPTKYSLTWIMRF